MNRRIKMICRCSKCKETHEYHKGPVTGGRTGKYSRLKKQINESGISVSLAIENYALNV